MSVDVSTLHTRIGLLVAAIDASNYAAARRYLAGCEALLIGIPNSNKGDAGYQFRTQLDGLRKSLTELESTDSDAGTESLGIQRQSFEYVAPTGGSASDC